MADAQIRTTPKRGMGVLFIIYFFRELNKAEGPQDDDRRASLIKGPPGRDISIHLNAWTRYPCIYEPVYEANISGNG